MNRSCAFGATPISGACFLGRNDLIAHALAQATLDLPPLLSVDGPLKIGRTSLLRYVEHLSAAGTEAGAALRPFLSGNDGVIALTLSLQRVRRAAGTLERQLVGQIVRGLKTVNGFEDSEKAVRPDADGALERLSEALRDSGRPFLLMLDDAEILLGSADSDLQWKDEVDTHLGTLHEYVERFSLLFAFGPSDELEAVDPASRREREREYLTNVSRFFGLKIDRQPLGLLDPADAAAFCRQVINERDIDGDESIVAMITALGGGHPLLINVVGIEVLEALRRDARLDRKSILATSEERLTGFVRRIVARVGTTAEAAEALLAVAEDGEATLPAELADLLAAEGLVRISRSGDSGHVCVMDAAVLRYALPRSVARARSATNTTASSTDAPAFPVYADRGITRTVIALTEVEHKLMRELLKKPGETVSREVLLKRMPHSAQAADPSRANQRLNQRLSSLRRKLRDGIEVGDEIIEPVYGRGYRLAGAERFKID
jgi:hypothetical protein